jgi:CRP-like cAMP-binding protein
MCAFAHVRFLDRLPAADKARLMPALQRVTLAVGDTLYQVGQTAQHIFFPLTAQVQEVLPMNGGHEEVLRCIAPNEMVGSCVLGNPVAARTARVSQAGDAWRMAYADFARALEEVASFRELVMQDALAGTSVV